MLKVNLTTPQGILYSGNALFVTVSTANGPIGIYKDHQPILANLSKGEIKISAQDQTKKVYFNNSNDGIVFLDNNEISIIAPNISEK